MSNHKEQWILETASSAGITQKKPAVFGTLGYYISSDKLCQGQVCKSEFDIS